jgi:hypothetical protein
MESKIATAAWVTAPGQWEPGALRWCFYDCNVLGDPAFAIFTANPYAINASYPASILVGTASMNVNVVKISGGAPASGLTCVAMKDGNLIGKAITDSNGNATIVFDPLVNDPGDAQLIISGYNCTPVAFNFAVIPAPGPYVVYATNVVNDPTGNLNSQPDFGESILLTTGMKNLGGTDATNILVTLRTLDPYITLADTSEVYPLIAAGDTLSIENAFSFSLADSIPDQHTATFTLVATGTSVWTSNFQLTCNAPHLACGSLAIDDNTSGNGNGRLDPGETANLIIPALNNGHSTCANAIASIASTSPWLTILSPTCQLGTIASNGSVNGIFQVQVVIRLLPEKLSILLLMYYQVIILPALPSIPLSA